MAPTMLPGIMTDMTTMTVMVGEATTMTIAMIGMVDGAMTAMTMIATSVGMTMEVEVVGGTQTTDSGAGAPPGTTTAAAGIAEGEWEQHCSLLPQWHLNRFTVVLCCFRVH